MNIKSFDLRVKDIDTSARIVQGYFASFGYKDSDGDIIEKGAFAKTIMENGIQGKNRIKHLYNHWDTVGVLQELKEDDFGLFFSSKIGTHTLGNDVLAMYNDGIITEHSIGFKTIKEDKDHSTETNIIKELMLWEGSSLDKWGANERTPVLKSKEEAKVWLQKNIERYDILTKALNNRTNYTDETYQNFAVQVQYLKSIFMQTLDFFEPSTDTQEKTEPLIVEKGADWHKILNNLKP